MSEIGPYTTLTDWRKLMKREAKWQTALTNYLRESKMTGYFELKNVMGKAFTFSKIEKVQYDSAPALAKNGLVWKFSDEDSRQKMCDCISAPPMPYYLVIKYPEPSEFHIIDMKEIIKLREGGSLGISQEQSAKIAEKIIQI